jgi:hypothetical protein
MVEEGDDAMASRIIRPVERMTLDFSAYAGGGTLTTTYLARRINVAPFKEVTAYVRFHAGTSVVSAPSTSLLNINADGFTDEDPGAVNSGSTDVAFQTLLGSATSFASITSGGSMTVIAVPANFGSMLSLSWSAKASITGTFRYVLSIDLICKEF